MNIPSVDPANIPNPNIPSLGGQKIAGVLHGLVGNMPSNHSIVETGAWLGSGTWHLAAAAAAMTPTPKLHVYDRFEANESEAKRATDLGVPLEAGSDTLPVVREHLNEFLPAIEFHKGDLGKCQWNGGPIGLLVDDAAKKRSLFSHLLRTFGPSFVPGETVLVLMDFHYWKKHATSEHVDDLRAQSDFMAAHSSHFEHLGDPNIRATSTAVFRYISPLDFSAPIFPWS